MVPNQRVGAVERMVSYLSCSGAILTKLLTHCIQISMFCVVTSGGGCIRSSNPKLKRFLGRPKDISPKAYLLNLVGYARDRQRRHSHCLFVIMC